MSDPAYRKGDFIKSYFASFDATGTPLIDDILYRIARAGKAHHSTEWWDESTDYGNDEAPSHLEMIQAAAQQAADRIEQLETLIRDTANGGDTMSDHRTFLAEARRLRTEINVLNTAGMRGDRAVQFHWALQELLELIELGEVDPEEATP